MHNGARLQQAGGDTRSESFRRSRERQRDVDEATHPKEAGVLRVRDSAMKRKSSSLSSQHDQSVLDEPRSLSSPYRCHWVARRDESATLVRHPRVGRSQRTSGSISEITYETHGNGILCPQPTHRLTLLLALICISKVTSRSKFARLRGSDCNPPYQPLV